MPLFLEITSGGMTDSDIVRGIHRNRFMDYNTQEESATNGEPFLALVTDVVSPTFDSETQYAGNPVYSWDGTTAGVVFTIFNKTQEDMDIEQLEDDIDMLKDAGKDVVLILTEFVDWALANTSMTAADFTPAVIAKYQELKIIADRVK